jgi:hypothetical protein
VGTLGRSKIQQKKQYSPQRHRGHKEEEEMSFDRVYRMLGILVQSCSIL